MLFPQMYFRLVTLMGICVFGFSVAVIAEDDFSKLIQQGDFKSSAAKLQVALDAEPRNDNLRMQVGTLQFLHALESVGQAWYRYGMTQRFHFLDFLPTVNLMSAFNPQPEKVTYQEFRDVFLELQINLAACENTLSEIQSTDVAMVIALGQIGMDFNRNGRVEVDERMSRTIVELLGSRRWSHLPKLEVRCDYSDVLWLRGYCQLLTAVSELLLAYDFEEVWSFSALQAFPNAQIKYDFIVEEWAIPDNEFDRFSEQWLDFVAAIHKLDLKLVDAERVRRSHAHLTRMVSLSRDMWASVQAETDDDREWIPNPRQKPPLPDIRITDDMVTGWQEFLDEFDDILAGRKLIAFWRGTNPALGVNLRRAMLEPKDLDIILWVQGAGALDYLQDDLPISKPETWSRINGMFRGEFFRFAVWVN